MPDAVGIDAAEIGPDHQVRRQIGDGGRSSPPVEDRDDEGLERRGRGPGAVGRSSRRCSFLGGSVGLGGPRVPGAARPPAAPGPTGRASRPPRPAATRAPATGQKSVRRNGTQAERRAEMAGLEPAVEQRPRPAPWPRPGGPRGPPSRTRGRRAPGRPRSPDRRRASGSSARSRLQQRIARRRQVPVAGVHQVRAQQEHQRGLPPATVGVVGEGAPLVGRERPPQRRLDAREVSPAEELPRHVARERGHRDAVAARHDRGRLLEGDQVAGPGVPVRYQDVPEPRRARARP